MLRLHDVELDRVKHVASRGGELLDLTPKEFQLLEYLMLHTEQVVRRTELLESPASRPAPEAALPVNRCSTSSRSTPRADSTTISDWSLTGCFYPGRCPRVPP